MSATAYFEKKVLNGTQTVLVEGYDWGPCVKESIICFCEKIRPESVDAEKFESIIERKTFPGQDASETKRSVINAYACDRKGKRTAEASEYLCLEMECDPENGRCCCYNTRTNWDEWCTTYELNVALKKDAALCLENGQEVTQLKIDPNVDLGQMMTPSIEGFVLGNQYTGTDGRSLNYAYYKPTGEKMPLVIWLHGAGDGGTDLKKVLLCNKVSALIRDDFQCRMGGAACILTPQTPTFWMQYDETGDWMNNPGKPSIYTRTLKELLDDFVVEHPEIDPARIYIGGCSNGGYMTMNMVMNYPDYFAAAYPICEGYMDDGIANGQLEKIRDVPIWFVYAENDTTVTPKRYEVPTIARLRSMEANIHTSIFADVHDTTGMYNGADGKPYQYDGHLSWFYFFNDQCRDDLTGENLWSWLGQQSK